MPGRFWVIIWFPSLSLAVNASVQDFSVARNVSNTPGSARRAGIATDKEWAL